MNTYIEKHYNNSYHSGIKKKPIEKFLLNAQNLRFLKSKQELDYMFLYRVTRKVNNDSTISIDHIVYEVPGNIQDLKLILDMTLPIWIRPTFLMIMATYLKLYFKSIKLTTLKLEELQRKKLLTFHHLTHNKGEIINV